METKHTKGEWIVKSNSELCWVESKTHHIATVSFGNEANAKLIAASPDLLEALIKCKNQLASYSSEKSIDCWYLAEQAIKKATS
jgi:hypothetical protein